MCAHVSGRALRMITFQGRWGGGVPNDFILSFCFGLSDITLFQVILGLLGISITSMLCVHACVS